MRNEQGTRILAYVGTYTGHGSEGIYIYDFDSATGALKLLATVPGEANPSFLALHPSGRYLYTVNELSQYEGQPAGSVAAFAIDSASGLVTRLGRRSSVGSVPCHVRVDATGRYALVANYGSGSVVCYPIEADGRLGEPTGFAQHAGASRADEGRQEGPHAHAIMPDPSNRFAYAPDLGLDQVVAYRLDPKSGELVGDVTPTRLPAGAGPRHIAFHPNGRYAYVINELNSTMSALEFDDSTGELRLLESLSTLPPHFDAVNYCADVHVHPSGRFVYGSNRGHDSIVIFGIDAHTGRLQLIGHEPTQGKWPRNFAIDASGEILLAANQESDSIVAFRIDPETGRLTPTGQVTQVSKPVCIQLLTLNGAANA